MSTAPLDKDGFPPCAMTLEEFVASIKESFGDRDYRICAFQVRAVFTHSTLTLKRGVIRGMRATKVQREACEASMRAAGEGGV